jgi:hypothetical protein
VFGTYNRLNVHVGASDIDVVRAARRKLKKSVRRARVHREGRHAFYRKMLAYHHEARDLFIEWRF